jgi:hypothetical protein
VQHSGEVCSLLRHLCGASWCPFGSVSDEIYSPSSLVSFHVFEQTCLSSETLKLGDCVRPAVLCVLIAPLLWWNSSKSCVPLVIAVICFMDKYLSVIETVLPTQRPNSAVRASATGFA